MGDQIEVSAFAKKSTWRRLLTGVVMPGVLAAQQSGYLPSTGAAILLAITSGISGVMLATGNTDSV